MKKTVILGLITAALSVGAFTACDKKSEETTTQTTQNIENLETIKVGATPSPHAEILQVVKPILEEKGYNLEIVEYSDYVQPNVALEEGSLFANYFQHQPYLDNYNEENNGNLVSIATIHYEPFGIYSDKLEDLTQLEQGDVVSVPNDSSNEARALLLLQAQGLIKLKDGVGLEATIQDIIENPLDLDIKEIEAAQLPRTIQDVDIAVINGNYAIPAGLSVKEDALAIEDAQSISAKTYGNVIAVHIDNEDSDVAKALKEAFFSDEVKDYIETTYDGAVVPMF